MKEGGIAGFASRRLWYTLVMADGAVYDGRWCWIKGELEGTGKHITTAGGVLEGNFYRNQYHGVGTMMYGNGDLYEREWVKGKQHGMGELTRANGEVKEGQCEAGKFVPY